MGNDITGFLRSLGSGLLRSAGCLVAMLVIVAAIALAYHLGH